MSRMLYKVRERFLISTARLIMQKTCLKIHTREWLHVASPRRHHLSAVPGLWYRSTIRHTMLHDIQWYSLWYRSMIRHTMLHFTDDDDEDDDVCYFL